MDVSEMQRLVEDDGRNGVFRIRRQAFVDPQLLEQERRAIFDRCWLYAGHASEVPETGCYVTRTVGGRPIVLVRTGGGVKVLLNACPHRGNIVCRERRGKVAGFVCFYHAWSFSLDGALHRVPFDDAYGALDRAAHGLKEPARVVNYRGLVFVNFDARAMDFEAYLGNARDYLDQMLDYDEQQEIVDGAQRYSMKANWKLLVENSIDMYHALVVHQRFFSTYMGGKAEDLVRFTRENGDSRGLQLDNGHGLLDSATVALPLDRQTDAMRAHRDKVVARFGPERAAQILDRARNLFLFPNFIFISNWRTIRTFYPVTPDYMEVDSWGFMPAGEPAEVRKSRLENFISFLGPAGFGTPDDVEALEGCQTGYRCDPQAWSDVSRGMQRARPVSSDELQMRSFWRQWRDVLATPLTEPLPVFARRHGA